MNEQRDKIKQYYIATISAEVGDCPDELAERLTAFLLEYAYNFATKLLELNTNEANNDNPDL
jgi:hypothetical protein